jgi:pumilio family protein 6
MLLEAVEDPFAHRILLNLLSPENRRYLPQAVLEMMHPAQRTIVGSSGKMVTDLEGDEVSIGSHDVSFTACS